MQSGQPSNIRTRLRSDTSALHAQLDMTVSHFDLQTETGLRGFLTLQELALQRLSSSCQVGSLRGMALDFNNRVHSDRARLGSATQKAMVPALRFRSAPLGVELCFGRRTSWNHGFENAAVLKIDQYFGAPGYIEIWKTFCTQALDLSPIGPLANLVVGNANGLLKLYLKCALQAREQTVSDHV